MAFLMKMHGTVHAITTYCLMVLVLKAFPQRNLTDSVVHNIMGLGVMS
jgi:hypothetical protein